MLEQKIKNIKKIALDKIKEVASGEQLFEVEKTFLGRKSEFISILKGLKDLDAKERKKIGELANSTKNEILGIITKKKDELSSSNFDFEAERIDVTIPGKRKGLGHLNTITLVRNEIEDIFIGMGYEIADGPEVETEWYNFDALNIPANHPARDMQDTFWLRQKIKSSKLKVQSEKEERLAMRSQTSAVQAKYMENNKPPFKIIVPGKCFRAEATDSTHEHTFYQFEALVVGDNINVGHLKYTAQVFFSRFFQKDIKVRLRPSYFPFTEPSFEFDISCTVCGGKGCSACRHAGWLELGGAGMVN